MLSYCVQHNRFYAPQVFLATGQSTSNALLSAVIIGLVNVAATVVAIVAVDKMGRRFLLLQGGVQMVITQVTCWGVLVFSVALRLRRCLCSPYHTPHLPTRPSPLLSLPLSLLLPPSPMLLCQVVVAVLLKHMTEGVTSHAMSMSLVSMICLYVAAFAWSW